MATDTEKTDAPDCVSYYKNGSDTECLKCNNNKILYPDGTCSGNCILAVGDKKVFNIFLFYFKKNILICQFFKCKSCYAFL